VADRKDVISLGIGEPDFVTPWHIRESAIAALEKGATRYTANLGMPELRQAIAEYVERSYGARYDGGKEVLVTVGGSEALDLAIRAVLEPGDEVLYHEPCFVAYAPLVRMARGVPVPVETHAADGFRLRVDALEARVTPRTRALLLNFPTNPTGAALRRQDVQDIAAFAKKHNLLVITDEIYSELTYDGERVSVAAEPGMQERTIFLNGFSKAFAMTGFRIGYACGPAAVIDAMMKIHQYSMLCAGITAQEAALEALRNGRGDMLAMKQEYCDRRNFIVKSLNKMGLKCHKPEGAFYVFPNITASGLSSKDFATKLLMSQKVAVVPGTAFGSCGEGFVRCSYATSMDGIKEAMDKMSRFLKEIS